MLQRITIPDEFTKGEKVFVPSLGDAKFSLKIIISIIVRSFIKCCEEFSNLVKIFEQKLAQIDYIIIASIQT